MRWNINYKKSIVFGVILCSFAFFSNNELKGQLYINEFQASNIDTKLDFTGNYHEWVEFYNAGSSSVNLRDYWLSNDLSNPYQHQIGGLTVPAGAYGMTWINKDNYDPSSIFRLYMEGGTIGLFTPDGELVDSVSFPEQYQAISYGRYPNGSNQWGYFYNPSPVNSNTEAAIAIAEFPAPLEFSLKAGIYQGNQVLELYTSDGEGTIRYTTDGAWPDDNSTVYSNPIQLSETSVIRAYVEENGKLPGPINTRTYIINDSSSIPIVSIVTDRKHFYHDKYGFFIVGTNGTLGRCAKEPVNWNQDWERPANIEYFDPDGSSKINQMVGLQIYGGCSRMLSYKSIAVIARKKYGDNSLSHRFFQTKETDEFKSIVLRNSGNDAYESMFRDGFMQSTVAPYLDLDLQGYQPATIYMNGEYWGILNVREKLNEHYPASNYELNSDEIDFLERTYYNNPVAGSGEHYLDVLEYVNNNSLSDPNNFAYIKTQVDVNEFMNYFLAQIYFANEDWPHNNCKYWRPAVEGGKWRWIVYDTDFGWGLYPRSGNTIEHATTDGESSVLFNAMLENEEFRNEFIQRMASLINTAFHPDNITPLYDSLLSQLEGEIYRHIDRWKYPKIEEFQYQTQEKMPDFTQDHPELVRTQFRQKFNIGGMFELGLAVNDPSKGFVRASGIQITDGFHGSYFDNIPLRMEAVPASGYRFSHWEGDLFSENKLLYIDTESDVSINAVFQEDSQKEGLRINEISAINEYGALDEFGQKEDWIEIYNGNTQEIDLAGLFLSDNPELPLKYRIPDSNPGQTTLRAGELLLIWCDEEEQQGPLHSNFKLKKEGETLYMWQKIGGNLLLLDSLSYPSMESGLSYGILASETDQGYMFPSPGYPNDGDAKRDLKINEFQTKNCGSYIDEYGEASDWIEIYNSGSDTLDIGGLFLTDSLDNPLKHQIPAGSSLSLIPPQEYLILWADNDPSRGVLHLDFKLDARKEEIGLYQPGHGYIDSVTYTLKEGGPVLGRIKDGVGTFQKLSPSPKSSNYLRQLDNLYINEFMAKNVSSIADQDSGYSDWIEIFNENDFPIDLGGLYLTDSLNDPTKFRISACMPEQTTVEGGGYIVLWADNQEDKGATHIGFKLSAMGEEIGLFLEDGVGIIDSMSYSKVEEDMAIGRLQDGSDHIQILNATPGSTNTFRHCSNLYISEFYASGESSYTDNYGEYCDWIEIYNDNDYAVNIGGFYISDSIDDLSRHYISRKHPDSTTIAPKDFLVLWADNQEQQGIRHLGFKLNGKGEQLILLDMDGTSIIDSVSFPNQYSNYSYSRLNQIENWKYLRPSPNAPNINLAITGLYINEFMSSNSVFPDEFGEYDDWIELYNSIDVPIDIGGLYLSDSLGKPDQYRIPSHSPDETTIAAQGYLVLYADNQKDQGVLHTNFKLNSDGESIILSDANQNDIIDSITYAKQIRNSSMGYLTEFDEWSFVKPSPGARNYIPSISGLRINEIMASNTSIQDGFGEFDDWLEIYNSNDFPVDVGGLYLSDSLGKLYKYQIPADTAEATTIGPHSYLVLFADGQTEQGPLHTNFKLSRKKESIYLVNMDQKSILDSLSFKDQYINSAIGYLDKDNSWGYVTPSPGSENYIPDFSSLVINEVMGYNRTLLCDEVNEYDDWIELYNSGDGSIDVGGLFITDSLDDKTHYRIPSICPDSTTIGAGDYLLLWADKSEDQGILHMGIKISKTGEQIALFGYRGELIDSISYPFVGPNMSFGRISDGSCDWTVFGKPTPLGANIKVTGMNLEGLDDNLKIFPNPVSEVLNLEIKSDEACDLRIELIDGQGKLCGLKLDFHPGGGQYISQLNLNQVLGSSQNNGLFYCRIVAGERTYSRKILVKR